MILSQTPGHRLRVRRRQRIRCTEILRYALLANRPNGHQLHLIKRKSAAGDSSAEQCHGQGVFGAQRFLYTHCWRRPFHTSQTTHKHGTSTRSSSIPPTSYEQGAPTPLQRLFRTSKTLHFHTSPTHLQRSAPYAPFTLLQRLSESRSSPKHLPNNCSTLFSGSAPGFSEVSVEFQPEIAARPFFSRYPLLVPCERIFGGVQCSISHCSLQGSGYIGTRVCLR